MAETYDPILSIEDLTNRGLLQRPPVIEPGVALVCSGNGKNLLVLKQGDKTLTWGEARWGYNKVYRVDLTEHPLSFQCDVPCRGDAYKFHAEIAFRCTVSDPKEIVERNVTDVAQWVKSSVEDVMRTISREYDLKESGKAEIEIREAVKQQIDESGLSVSKFTLKLSLSQDAINWVQTQRHIKEEIELEKTKQDLVREKNKFEIEQEQTRAEQERKQIEEQQKLENQLKFNELQAKLQQQDLEHRLAQQQADFELKLMEQKTKVYSSMLQSGNLQLLALQLAQNPEDVRAILEALNQQKQIERENNIRILQTLLDADVIEGWQLTEVGKRALQEIIGLPEQSKPALQSGTDKIDAHQEPSAVIQDVTNVRPSSTQSEPDWEDNENGSD